MTFAVSTRTRHTVGLLLLAGMFILRIPLMLVGLHLFPQFMGAVATAFTVGTYVLTGGLLVWERDRLAHFHMDKWATGLWIMMPPLTWAIITPLGMAVPWLPSCAAVVMVTGLILLVKRPQQAQTGSQVTSWMVAAIAAGIVYGGLIGFGSRLWTDALTGVGLPALFQVLPAFLLQMTNAAGAEEPFFRGFLWGYLRDAGWQERWIWLLQAGLFLVGHLEPGRPAFNLYQVPLAALLFGWLAWRSRSISTSMIAHGLSNALGAALSRF